MSVVRGVSLRRGITTFNLAGYMECTANAETQAWASQSLVARSGQHMTIKRDIEMNENEETKTKFKLLTKPERSGQKNTQKQNGYMYRSQDEHCRSTACINQRGGKSVKQQRVT